VTRLKPLTAAAIASVLVACSGAPTQTNYQQHLPAPSPLPYSVLEVRNISTVGGVLPGIQGRKRFSVSIAAPEAKTFNQRGLTVVTAARELQSQYGADVVQVWLEPNANTKGLGFVLAMATFSPDGKGMSGNESGMTWDSVSATGYQPSPRALKMTGKSSPDDIGLEQAKVIMSRRPYTP
jgi:Domain of unknown function (DUF4875)